MKMILFFFYSGFVLKELEYSLNEIEFNKKRKMFDSTPNFNKILASPHDFEKARKIESELRYEISFFDIFHMLLSEKTNSILITRDRKLLDVAKKFKIEAKKPEDEL